MLLFKSIRDKIEDLKEAEVDLDDEDSAYIMEEKYQKKFVKVWNKLCELKASSKDTGRPAEKKFRYSGMSCQGQSMNSSYCTLACPLMLQVI